MHYVIGDVHGCFKELKLLLNKIETKDSDAIIYFVGDWIDRGKQVADVMQWVVDNITTDGKYRSVRGNHDQEALDWYNASFLPWLKEEHGPYDLLPETYYDFAFVVDNCFNRDPEALRPFFDKVKSSMPYNLSVEITTIGGVDVTYRIAHAWHSNSDERGPIEQINLYERNYWGYFVDDEIIVHGHTPTISHDYLLRSLHGEERPGMIGYRYKDINVDSGCCFRASYPEYPCMLSAICLETLEEIYSHSVEERLLEGAQSRVSQMSEAFLSRLPADVDMTEVVFEQLMEDFNNKKPDSYRQELLETLGLS